MTELLGLIMPLLNFTVFTDKILSGEKKQTIRRERNRPIKKGDLLHLFSGLRTKNCKKLLLAKVSDVQKIHISESQLHIDFMGHIAIENKLLSDNEMDELAVADGFNSLKEFVDFFNQHYGLPFDGVVIKWGPLPNAPAGRFDRTVRQCPCLRCLTERDKADGRFLQSAMQLCPVCGNKRCPKGTDHDLECTGSNEPGQKGSSYA